MSIMTQFSAHGSLFLAMGLINHAVSTRSSRVYVVCGLRSDAWMSKQPNCTATGAQATAELELSDRKPSQNDVSPKRRSNLNYRTIEGETVILNREGGCLHQLNATASFIWNCCNGIAKISEIADDLVGAYEVDSITARKDVEDVVSQLRSANLLELY
jgi:hypothetical protein